MRAEFQLLGRYLRANPHWVLLFAVYASAWYFPVSLLWRLLHPGQPVPDGMDGPISWNWRWWLQPSSPLSFQLLVPIGVILLLLRRRVQLASRWQRLRQRHVHSVERVAAHAILILGCVILLIAHLVHVISLAVFALQLIGVGVIARVFGLPMVRTLMVPLLFWLTMSMPPETIPAKLEERMEVFSARGAASLLRLQKRPTTAEGWTLAEGGARIGVSPASSGGALAGATLVFVLWHALYTGRRAGQILVRLGVSGAIALTLNVLRVTLVGRLNPSASDLAQQINGLNPWWLVPVSIGLSFGVFAASRRIHLQQLSGQFDALSRRTARPLDRALDSSGRALSQAGGRLTVLSRPLEVLAQALEFLLIAPFRLLTRSSQQVEGRLRRWERAQRQRKRDRR